MPDAMAPAEGVRLEWNELPDSIRSAVQDIIGWPVASARTQPGGFSPGVAARIRSADGRRAFVKAVSTGHNADAPDIHRREARIAAALPAGAPVPHLVGVHDDGAWVALVFTDVDGRLPRLPWHSDELATVMSGIGRLHAALTPSPVDDAPDIVDELAPIMNSWQGLGADPSMREQADEWCRRHLDALIALTRGWESGVHGDTLLHSDLRADNILLTTGGPVFVDWPWAARGAAWVDPALMAPSVAAQGGPAPAAFLAQFPTAAAAPNGVLAPFVVGLAGYFTYAGLQPPPPGLPTLRRFQTMQARTARRWAQQLTGLE